MPAGRTCRVALLIAFFVAVPLMIGCAKGAPLNDATLTTRVKTAILNDPMVGKLPIDVDTVSRVVTLSGRVATEAQRDRAVTLARSVPGVVNVKDTLQIIPKVHNTSQRPAVLAHARPGGPRGVLVT